MSGPASFLRCTGVGERIFPIVGAGVTPAGTPVGVDGIEGACLTAAVGTDCGATEAGEATGVNVGRARPVDPPALSQAAASIGMRARAKHRINTADAMRLTGWRGTRMRVGTKRWRGRGRTDVVTASRKKAAFAAAGHPSRRRDTGPSLRRPSCTGPWSRTLRKRIVFQAG